MSELRLPDRINYECTACGKCCSGWAVPMTEADYDRISAVDWGQYDKRFSGVNLFRELRRYEKQNTPYSHKIVSDTGVCPFLVDNLCFIHSKNGSEFKPSICQLFPYCFSVTPSGVYATVSYVSAGAVYNSGLPLNQQQELLERKYAEFCKLYPEHKPDWSAIQLTVNQPMGWQEYLDHEAVMLAILSDGSRSLKEKLLSCSDYLRSRVVKPQAASGGTAGGATPDALAPVQSAAATASEAGSNTKDDYVQLHSRPRAASEPVPLKDIDEHLLATFHQMYFPAKPLKQGDGDFNAVRFILQKFMGSKKLAFAGQMERLSQAELLAVPWPEDDAEIAGVFERYVYSHIFGKKYFGAGFGNVSLIAGFHHLCMVYALARLHARGLAKMRGAPQVSMVDVVVAVRQLERQLGETRLGGWSCAVWELLLFSGKRLERFMSNC